ncbi:5'-3' exonuclease [Salipaludibacillus aurantiacus]|uniref:5'-3' exonuclease n=1 Tax=Salipaludibacillus aurantiacus TaxID=1601833 RepID=A0A1H9VRT2_9BACI|nr:5'-3' exonuclease [Salipaludibacillus aurantiacus]SES24375.1 5'-3' exonuclease [Salipaludibacillus aurantiacus]
MKENTLLLIDGFNLLSRGYFATAYGRSEEQLSKNEKGEYVNAARVFFQKLFQLTRNYNITHLSVAWDGKREDTARNQKYAFYKAQRTDLPDPLIEQYHLTCELLDNLNIHQMSVAGFEADDIIGAFSDKWYKNDLGQTFIYSNDRDLFQLLNETTNQILAKKKQEIIYSADRFKDDFDISPSQWVDVKALLGDPSDNIPGCPGVGEKSALPLIRQYGNLKQLFKSVEELDPAFKRYKKKLHEGQESCWISRELSEIVTDIEEVAGSHPDELKLDLDEETVLREMNGRGIRVKVR